MPRKAFELAVELDIHAVTCPGVWLCPSGQLTLCAFMLDSCAQTSRQQPVFPILFHEMFIFHKTFHSAHSLADLQEDLSKQFLYAELVQWVEDSDEEGSVLANFQTSLTDLLYPSVCDRGLIAGVDVDLLMEPCKCFPGIIAPKVEVSTKTTIREVVNKCKHDFCMCRAFVVNPKTIPSKLCRKRGPAGRQKVVCHTSSFHRARDRIRWTSSGQHKKYPKYVAKPPFVVKKVASARKCECKPPTTTACFKPVQRKCRRDRSPVGDGLRTCREVKWNTIGQVTSDTEGTSLCNLLRTVRLSPKVNHKDVVPKCLCGKNSPPGMCAVCTQYQKYFEGLQQKTERDRISEILAGPINIHINDQPIPEKRPCRCPKNAACKLRGPQLVETIENGVTVEYRPASPRPETLADQIHVKVDSALNSDQNSITVKDNFRRSREPSTDRRGSTTTETEPQYPCKIHSRQTSSRGYNTAPGSKLAESDKSRRSPPSTPISKSCRCKSVKTSCTCAKKSDSNRWTNLVDKSYKSMFYCNLEKFYKKLYKRAHEKALNEMLLSNCETP